MNDMGGQFASIAAGALGLGEGAVPAPGDPDTLLEGERVLDLGGVTVRLYAAGANHTPNSLVAVIEADKVVYAGDLLYSGRLLAILPESEPASWIEGFDALRAFEGYTFIPGHGVPAALAAFEFSTYSYLTLMHGFMTKAVEDGVAIEEAMRAIDQSAYAGLVNFDLLAGANASWAYQRAELDGF
jgi:glyoxylase-like metal-dependent hydrolase (beta-lactamase superfamily II)